MSPPKDTITILTDAAVSAKKLIAIGAFLCLDQAFIDLVDNISSSEDLATKVTERIIFKEYTTKKSTWSEIQTVIQALKWVQRTSEGSCNIIIYTDCQSLCDLLGIRKEKLLTNSFMTKAGKIHPNAALYKELFRLADQFHLTVFKIKGHNASINRVTVYEKIFAILDKLTRKKLRSTLNNVNL